MVILSVAGPDGASKSFRNAKSSAQLAKYKGVLKTWQDANPLIKSLRETGKLPSNYVTQDVAKANGWSKGKALGNYIKGAQMGGDIFENDKGILPIADGRVWYEADVGLVNTMGRNKQTGTRLLYSNDGQMYITVDHYENFYYIGNYLDGPNMT
ncbi:ribonuclease domain-containing protein [Brevibacillus choshinensis]|uniref:ribonuclease domain-containing protein n=1 Tax=Brevibacillus choshinensis TaxID=54911 RepID=UPI00399C8689